MTQYHFYTGAYLSNFLHYVLSENKAGSCPLGDWSHLTSNDAVKQDQQAVHVLFYENLVKAFRELYHVCSAKFLDSEIYAILHYSLTCLCAEILQQRYETCRFQRIHFIYSAGDKLSLKNSMRVNERYISKMVNEMNYRFFLENLVSIYEPAILSKAMYKKVFEQITHNEMLPTYQVNQCLEIMKWCNKNPQLSIEDADELSFFRFYHINYQDKNAQKHFHTYQENIEMQEFLTEISKEPAGPKEKAEIFLDIVNPHKAGYSYSPEENGQLNEMIVLPERLNLH